MASRAAAATKTTLRIAAALLAILVLFPIVTGRPLLSFPTSSSMVPTLDPFDAFFVEPYPHDLRVGDIIVFQSVTTGGPAVHRIVGIDPSGAFLTKGDANPQEDQAGREPPVGHDRILGRVLTWTDGSPVRIPKLGLPLTEARLQLTKLQERLGGRANGLSLLLIAGACALAIPTFVFRDRFGDPSTRMGRGTRAVLRRLFPRGILGGHVALVLLIVLGGSVAVAVHAAHTDAKLGVIVVADARIADGARTLAPGQSIDRTVDVASLSLFPTVAIVEPASPNLHGARTVVHIAPLDSAPISERQTAGDITGLQTDKVAVWRYPAVLPIAWLVAMHDTVPGGPDLAFGALVAAALLLWLHASGLLARPVGTALGLREAWR